MLFVSAGSQKMAASHLFPTATSSPVQERSSRKRSRYAQSFATKKIKVGDKTKSKSDEKTKNNATKHAHESEPTRKNRSAPDQVPTYTRRRKIGGRLQDSTKCSHCFVRFGAKNDTRMCDDWIKCQECSKWYHESCAEIVGVLDDAEFHCRDCFWYYADGFSGFFLAAIPVYARYTMLTMHMIMIVLGYFHLFYFVGLGRIVQLKWWWLWLANIAILLFCLIFTVYRPSCLVVLKWRISLQRLFLIQGWWMFCYSFAVIPVYMGYTMLAVQMIMIGFICWAIFIY